MTDENLAAAKHEANRNAKILVDYLRQQGVIGESPYEAIREYAAGEEVLHNACIAAYNLARKIAAL